MCSYFRNVWDAGCAKIIESLGVAAIATTSAGVARSRGYPDGDALPVDKLLATTREIARVIKVPLMIEPLPLNIMAVPSLPPIGILQESGVRRLSGGSAIAQAALALTTRLATAFLAGSLDEMFESVKVLPTMTI